MGGFQKVWKMAWIIRCNNAVVTVDKILPWKETDYWFWLSFKSCWSPCPGGIAHLFFLAYFEVSLFWIADSAAQPMQTSKNKYNEKGKKCLIALTTCFAIAKETASIVTMVTTSVSFYLQLSHTFHHGKNIKSNNT